MTNKNSIVQSLQLRDELNPDVWDKNKKGGYTLKPDIQKKLLKVSEIFLDYVDIDIFVQDIVLIGSLTGYNWSDFSDFDLHIMYDFNDAGDKKDLYKELFYLKKTVFNAKHDIRIKGFEVEVFIQDLNEKEKSVGSYSIMNKKWIRFPEKENFKIDEKKLIEKANQWIDIIDGVLENAEELDLDEALRVIKKYKNKLKKYRTCGLQKGGELSYENLVFKYLRRAGYLSKLDNFKNKVADKKLSLEHEIYN
jgi:hypothetical protein